MTTGVPAARPGLDGARVPARDAQRTAAAVGGRTVTQRNGNPRVSVVVPTRNEARNLEVVLPAIAAVRPAVHEVIVVDGNSVDGSIETAQRVLPWVKVITQSRRGKGNAMACGFAAASGDIIVDRKSVV